MNKAIIIMGITLGMVAASAIVDRITREAGEPTASGVPTAAAEGSAGLIDQETGASAESPLENTKVFNGTSSSECIKFGHVWQGEVGSGTDQGIGICIYKYENYQCTDYQDRDYTGGPYWDDYDYYQVLAWSGNDHIRFASNNEDCGNGWHIDDTMPDANHGAGFTQDFVGGAGNDVIFTEYTGDGTGDWGNAVKKASGGTGNDLLKGGYYVDYLHGDAGDDWLYGYSSDDQLDGDGDDDCIYGGNNDDQIVGDFGVDWMDGGSGTDTCYCSDGQGERYSCNGTPDYCDDSAVPCFTK